MFECVLAISAFIVITQSIQQIVDVINVKVVLEVTKY